MRVPLRSSQRLPTGAHHARCKSDDHDKWSGRQCSFPIGPRRRERRLGCRYRRKQTQAEEAAQWVAQSLVGSQRAVCNEANESQPERSETPEILEWLFSQKA